MDSIELKENKLTNVENVVYYIPNFITEQQEAYILEKVNNAPKPKWCQLKNRRLQNWGGIPHPKGLIPEKIPDWLKGFVHQVESLNVFPKTNMPNHVLVNEYLPGQGIMPHLDGSLFYPTISTINCGSHTVLNFYKLPKVEEEVESIDKAYSLLLERRSLLVLQENMYNKYMHGIDEIKNDIIDDRISNLKVCGSLINNGGSLIRNKRISLTIRNVPKVSKFNLNSLLTKH
ncbi:Oxoglutarate/iron-dependent dioxygenase,Alpha-ketoglutarate-dependent dioxygenase AlkB-like [Cinara cedri]|uniref:Oxoglutarate/iron-dependent dioxygenase,Alpha-ketoglutarate-dependent dioxygenase AlkB-like n=1 Tax=Cinara cedri TaxID=506608 RepID=A0A5E4M2M3_9HEMI|nr:Oxoglutarate/iron-dependent dioxygenase,Alpha-ketoglutarate-dependent dioxygenase AlkB-like [Cinara cedri]